MQFTIQQLNELQVYASQNRWAEIVSYCEEIPNIAEVNSLAVLEVYATALAQIGRTGESIDVYQNALLHGMSIVDVLTGVGTAFLVQRKYKEALENYELALQQSPNNIQVHQNLVIAYKELGEIQKLVHSAQIVLRHNQIDHTTISNLASMYKGLGLIEQAIALYERVRKHYPEDDECKSNYLWCLLHSHKLNAKKLLSHFIHHTVKKDLSNNLNSSTEYSKRLKPNINSSKKIRIGFVSPDICDHVVGHFVIPLFAHLQKRFDVFIYSNSVIEDEYTRRAVRTTKQFRSIISLTTSQAVDIIKADNIDVLVDLAGHTAYNRLDIFACKPVRNQVTWLGCPTTTGLSTIDYIIIPPDPYLQKGGWSSETPIALSKSYYARERSYIPEISQEDNTQHRVLQLKDTGQNTIVFACMNHFAKVSDPCLRTWSTILQRCKKAKLLLLIKGIEEDIVRKSLLLRCEKHNIDPNQLILMNRLSKKEYFKLYKEVDIVLDPFPFNGGTTNVDCLCMHKPFVSLSGDSLHSRLGRNLLVQMELPELIAESRSEYINIALRLAENPTEIAEISDRIAFQIQNTSLTNVKKFAQELGDIFEKMNT